ncbi:hypothetical protein [Oceanisphaera pacifica]|uniref:MSP domain-containing protein n=1 Tax=Oceanisphaera pacifica TaxID=2818389 RepID=A0ABS3NJE6_9GAMM|nr:hypothetical protein [Oceanisphaera pacifica]MBO1520716.1 hypothetical protein [Oceanisphaera pacifica]
MKQVSNILLIIVTLTTCLNMIYFPWELRFVNTKYNYLFVMVLAIILPISAFFWSTLRDTKSVKVIGVIISVCLAIPCFLTFTFAKLDYADITTKGVDYSFEEINRLKVGDESYVLYRTNGGATTSFGLVLRMEKEIALGINAVNVIYSKYKASESSLELTNENQIKMQIQPYDKHGKVEVVVLSI